MAKPYTITLNNGTGTGAVLNGSYNATITATGYDTSKLEPKTINVVEGTNAYTFTVEANGTLTLHVSETGLAEGTAVVGAKFVRCDAAGTTYGDEITSDASGNAVFNYLPYAETGAPIIYYKQTASDGEHEFDGGIKQYTLTEQTATVEVINTPAVTRTFTLTDARYSGLTLTGTQELVLN